MSIFLVNRITLRPPLIIAFEPWQVQRAASTHMIAQAMPCDPAMGAQLKPSVLRERFEGEGDSLFQIRTPLHCWLHEA